MTRTTAGLLAASMFVVLGCSSSEERFKARLESNLTQVEDAVDRLGEQIDRGRIKNARMIALYADTVAENKPNLRELTDVLRLEGTRQGTMFQGLKTRVEDAKREVEGAGENIQALQNAAQEVQRLSAATDFEEYDQALTDPLNVLADLSDGALPRVDALSQRASSSANAAENLGAGQQLVGNPHYGQWRSNSSGNSFWVWYGQYALFRTLLGGPSIGYGRWAGGRNYSYYHDWGRDNYTSPTARSRQTQVESTARRKFASEGRNFNSPYAKKRQGASTRIRNQKSLAATRARSSTASRGYGSAGRGPRRGK